MPFFTYGLPSMTQNILDAQRTQPIARLGANHGYTLAGDSARLDAEILFDESRLCGQQWALQLWADEAIKIAELPLGLLPITGQGYLQASGIADAFPPAGQNAHAYSLRLVSDQEGINDAATYEQALPIIQPRLGGTLCSSFTTEEIRLAIARIENPRPADNLSGTLALELWALDVAYSGGAWQGTLLASQTLGSLAGETAWNDCQFNASLAESGPAAHLTLMLREWTPAGYLTRDFRELARPSPAASVELEVTAPAVAPTKVKESAKKAVKGKAAPAAAKAKLAINTTSAAEIGALKGVSKPLAQAIVAARPYHSLDDLLRVKGMGPKLLERLRGELSV